MSTERIIYTQMDEHFDYDGIGRVTHHGAAKKETTTDNTKNRTPN
jgi:hypothetical protein